MTKTEIKKRKKYILERIEKFVTAMSLTHYEGNVAFAEEDHDVFAALISTDITYLSFAMTIYPCVFDYSNKEIDKVIAHELCHIIIEPLAAIARLSVNDNTEKEFTRALENAVEHTSRLIASKL